MVPDLLMGVAAISCPQPVHSSWLDSPWMRSVVLWISLLVLASSLLLAAVPSRVIFRRMCFHKEGTTPLQWSGLKETFHSCARRLGKANFLAVPFTPGFQLVPLEDWSLDPL